MTKKRKYTLTGLLIYCQERALRKRGGGEFTISDIQGYVKRGKFPKYLGGMEIKKTTDNNLVKINPTYIIEE